MSSRTLSLLDLDPDLNLEKGVRLSLPSSFFPLSKSGKSDRLSSDARARTWAAVSIPPGSKTPPTERERAASPSARKVSLGSETRDDDAEPARSADERGRARVGPASTPATTAAERFAQRNARARRLVARAIALGIPVDDPEIARRTFLARYGDAEDDVFLEYLSFRAHDAPLSGGQNAVLNEARRAGEELAHDAGDADIGEVPIVRVAAVVPPPTSVAVPDDVHAALRDRDPAALTEALERAVAARRGAPP